MEPIVLLGLIVVGFGGYVALQDLREDISILFPRKVARDRVWCGNQGCGLKPPIKKMAGMHV